MNNDKLLTLLMGRCWHEPTDANNPFAESPCIHCGKTLIHWPHGWFAEGENITPDFSRPADRDEFFTWLCRERRKMWEGFTDWIDAKGERDLSIPAPWLWSKLIPWLFFSDPSRPRDLMAEWLRLDETVERFGWVTCGKSVITNGVCYNRGCDKWGECTGRIRAEWAKEVK